MTTEPESGADSADAAASTTAGGPPSAPRSGLAQLLEEKDALGLAELVARREVSPAELLEAAIDQVETLNPHYNFLAREHYALGRQAIADGLPEGPFTGVPWLLKDLNTYIRGEVTGQGSRYYADNRASLTSELVLRHQKAGLVIFGKTTTPEFGLTATTESKATGDTRNPWNRDRIAGGSSGGSAAAVAAGVLPAAHATDGGGSIRIPASCCGLFGLKPSRGRTPSGPRRTEGWGGLSVHHAITRSVRDSAALLDATHGLEPGSRYGAPTPERPFLEEVQRNPGRLRIALDLGTSPVDPDCAAAVRDAAQLCEALGHHVEEAAPALDHEAIGMGSLALIASSICADIEARQAATGIPPGPDVLETVTLAYYEIGQKTGGPDVVRGNDAFQKAAVRMARFMDEYDILLSPTLASPPVPLGVLDLSPDDVSTYFQNAGAFTPFARIFNVTGQPSMSVPLGMSRDGLPIGILFTARYGEEALLFRLAGQLEEAAPWGHRRPPRP